jgi:hypothetical protein
MSKKSEIKNRASKIWHLPDCQDAWSGAITDYRCQMSDFPPSRRAIAPLRRDGGKIPNL